jgi:hypothetical protein
MLFGNLNSPLPADELTAAAFRLTAVNTLIDIESSASPAAAGVEPAGYLGEVPLLAEVAPAVQVDLLADTWARHRSADRCDASLLDAAVIYAVCETAAGVVEDQPDLARAHLHDAPVPSKVPVDADLPERFRSLFESFWGDIDFVTLEQFEDTDPKVARGIKEFLGISKTQTKKIGRALARGHPEPGLPGRLNELLTEEELKFWSRFLVPPVVVSLRDVVGEFDAPTDTFQAFLNRRTGELFTASDEELRHLDDPDYFGDEPPAWQAEAVAKLNGIRDSDDWLELPSRHEIREWDLMAEFCESVADAKLREDLLDAIRGSGAFGRFKSMAHRHGLIDDWHRFRDRQVAEFVASWLKKHGIAYRD